MDDVRVALRVVVVVVVVGSSKLPGKNYEGVPHPGHTPSHYSFLRFPLGRGSFFLAGAGAFPPVVVATAAAMASASTVRENLFENEENLGTARAEQMRTRK
eukprot:COSAG06_NODE_5633_length_3348_cov_35.197291_6_plen_101_part_00